MTYRIALDKEENVVEREAATFSVSDGALFIWKDLNYRDPISSWAAGNWMSIEPVEIAEPKAAQRPVGYRHSDPRDKFAFLNNPR